MADRALKRDADTVAGILSRPKDTDTVAVMLGISRQRTKALKRDTRQ